MLERKHIGIFGARNVGKSSLINMITKQDVSIVSAVAGTTTDPITKPIEINGLGACVFIDTAGYDDTGTIGKMRVTRTKRVLERCDIAIFVLSSAIIADKQQLNGAKRWFDLISGRCDTFLVINEFSHSEDNEVLFTSELIDKNSWILNSSPIWVNAQTGEGRDKLLTTIGHHTNRYKDEKSIVTHLVKPGDMVLLVMPQDIQAPAGRLILPQQQTIRELLDFGCAAICATTATAASTLAKLGGKPDLIVTDSQAFSEVLEIKPDGVRLTSFSVLFAQWKGDIDTYIKGADTLSRLNKNSRVLIAEACTHAPLAEDIGREKIPNLIHRHLHKDITIDFVAGNDWSDNITDYDLIIQCGACMFSRAQVMNRIKDATDVNVPITNYGIAMAYFSKMIDKIVW
ncbi:MAG: [FeFe] hydrogenase H-cluster maturation GTPase HydF [bacterium]